MNKICIIYPWFGKLPNYFPLFIKSALNNEKVDFHFFTDNPCVQKYCNKNIFYHKESLETIKERATKFLNFNCVLNTPYKLCDYKPIYSDLFPITKKYEWWGFLILI